MTRAGGENGKEKNREYKIFSLILACVCILIFVFSGMSVKAADEERVSIAFE